MKRSRPNRSPLLVAAREVAAEERSRLSEEGVVEGIDLVKDLVDVQNVAVSRRGKNGADCLKNDLEAVLLELLLNEGDDLGPFVLIERGLVGVEVRLNLGGKLEGLDRLEEEEVGLEREGGAGEGAVLTATELGIHRFEVSATLGDKLAPIGVFTPALCGSSPVFLVL